MLFPYGFQLLHKTTPSLLLGYLHLINIALIPFPDPYLLQVDFRDNLPGLTTDPYIVSLELRTHENSLEHFPTTSRQDHHSSTRIYCIVCILFLGDWVVQHVMPVI